MKRAVLAFIILLSACSKTPEITFSEAKVEYGGTERTDVRILYPIAKSNNKAVEDSINNAIISSILSEDTPSFDAVIAEAKAYEKDSIPYANVTEWHGFRNKSIISIYLEHYLFTGGAHGGTDISTLALDAQTGKRINVMDHISDTAEFRRLLVKEYVDQNGLHLDTPAGEIGYFTELRDLPIPSTMELTNQGLVVIYGQYEVACYAVGITTATIPYEKLKGILNLDTTGFAAIEIIP